MKRVLFTASLVSLLVITLTKCSSNPVAEETKAVDSLLISVDTMAIKAIIDSSKADSIIK